MFFLLISAFLIRIWGVNFDLPNVYHDDEKKVVSTAFSLGSGDLNPHTFLYPTFYMYLLFIMYGIYYLLGLGVGIFKSLGDFQLTYYLNPTSFYLIARFTSTILGLFTILLLYLLAKQMYDRKIGFIAALFLAFSFISVRDAHFATVDTPVAFFILLAFIFIYRIFISPLRRNYLLAGALIGLATSVKYNAIFLFFPLLVIHCLSNRDNKKRLFFSSDLSLSFISAVSIFFITSPFIFFDFKTFIRDFSVQVSLLEKINRYNLFELGWFYHLTYTLRYGLGILFLLTIPIGILLSLFRSKVTTIIIMSFVLSYYFVIGKSTYVHARYMVPLVPFLSIFSSICCLNFTRRLCKRFKIGLNLALTAVLCIITVESVYRIFRHNILLTRDDTRTIAKNWIEKNISPDEKIALVGWRFGYPSLNETKERLKEKMGTISLNRHGSTLAYILSLDKYPLVPAYELIYVRSLEGWSRDGYNFDIDILKREIVNIVVLNYSSLYNSNFDIQNIRSNLKQAAALLQEISPYQDNKRLKPVYEFVDACFMPIANFKGVRYRGPFIEIYRF